MSEAARILDQLQRAYVGPAWHGPALTEILAGVSAQQASQRPIAGAHTIWEIVIHITVWMSVASRRVHGEELPSLPPDQDWPAPEGSGEGDWRRCLANLEEAQKRLEATIRELSDDRLREIVQGDQPQSIYVLLHGIVQHNLYHGGQIVILKKASRQP